MQETVNFEAGCLQGVQYILCMCVYCMCGWRWCVLERKYQTTGNNWTGTIHLYGYGTSSIGPLGSEIMGSAKSNSGQTLHPALRFN